MGERKMGEWTITTWESLPGEVWAKRNYKDINVTARQGNVDVEIEHEGCDGGTEIVFIPTEVLVEVMKEAGYVCQKIGAVGSKIETAREKEVYEEGWNDGYNSGFERGDREAHLDLNISDAEKRQIAGEVTCESCKHLETCEKRIPTCEECWESK